MSDPTYKVAIGPALTAKIPYGDPYWKEFNASFENQELPSGVLAARLYEGHTLTTWHADHWRHSRNYLCGQHLGVDFDTEDARSTLPVLLKDRFVAKYAGIVYTTPSHTPATPRARVIFLLDTPIMQAKNYTLAASALLWIFGTADRQCKDAVRFFYGGRPGACQMEWLSENLLPLALIKDLIARYLSTGQRTHQHATRTYTPGTADEREIAEALRHIPAMDISYDEWVSILMAIHSELPGLNGLQLAESWAEGKPGEVEQKWRSFHDTGNPSGCVTIATLFKIAKDHGWQRTLTSKAA